MLESSEVRHIAQAFIHLGLLVPQAQKLYSVA